MRRTFLVALLVGVCAVMVFAPAALTKKTPTPPSGAFTVGPLSAIGLTNMTLVSQDQVQIAVCIGQSENFCEMFQVVGSNAGVDPGVPVQLDDWGYVNEHTYPVQVRVVLADYTAGLVGYLSDGTLLLNGTDIQQGSHVTLGYLKEQLVLSMNDGSKDTFTASDPPVVLGAGNFNATVQFASLAPQSTGVTITSITGYSDGPGIDTYGRAACKYHAQFDYNANKAKTVQGAMGSVSLVEWEWDNALGYSEAATLTGSPFNSGVFFGLINPAGASDYAFLASIGASNNDLLALRLSSTFTFDPATYVDGCPPVGQLVPAPVSG